MSTKKSPSPKEIVFEHQALMSDIGNGIKKLRIEKNKRLIEMANSMKISRNKYTLLENGKIYFKFSTLLRILDYHQIKFTDFIKNL